MAANLEYVFFRMAAPVTSGPITGESVAPPQKQVVVAQEEVMAREKVLRGGYMPPGTSEEISRLVGRHQEYAAWRTV